MRFISWFSCGAASAVATKLLLEEQPDALVVRNVVPNEHEDNDRFAKDVAKWLNVEIIDTRSQKYKDCWELWEKRRFLNGPNGALCTVEMKKRVRQAFSLPDDVHIFGYTSEEEDRVINFEENNPGVTARFPLIERSVTKRKCYEVVQAAGIELPAMYRLGYNNANCIGCVKGGAGYWNKIRRDFPDVFQRMADLDFEIGASCIKDQPLKTLHPKAGRHSDLKLPDCGLFCGENHGWGKL